MPARIRKIRHDDNTRMKIKASNIVTRLQKFVMGEVSMEPAAVTAALGLLKKVLPDLTSVEHSGEITKNYVARMPAKVRDINEWEKQTRSLQ